MSIRAAAPALRDALLNAARANAKAKRVRLSQVSRAAYGDSKFFGNISRKSASFTPQKFDEMMRWFADPRNWPDGKVPDGVVVDVIIKRSDGNGEG